MPQAPLTMFRPDSTIRDPDIFPLHRIGSRVLPMAIGSTPRCQTWIPSPYTTLVNEPRMFAIAIQPSSCYLPSMLGTTNHIQTVVAAAPPRNHVRANPNMLRPTVDYPTLPLLFRDHGYHGHSRDRAPVVQHRHRLSHEIWEISQQPVATDITCRTSRTVH